MEPEGRPLTPGTSYGPRDFTTAQSPPPSTSVCEDNSTTQEPLCSPKTQDGPMSTERCWDSPEQTEGAEPGGSAQRRARSSAFHSSLSWDSDSEKETLDEEELLHLCNPHGLAAHSPGSPSTGLRLECEDSQEPEQVKALPTETDHSGQEEGHEKSTESTKTEEPNTSQTGTNHSADSAVWNVCERSESFLSQSPPKESCQTVQLEEEVDNTEGFKTHMGKESKKIPEKDVYTFPGDSDPESPPPAPWAHCTFIQRCRKKRVLLRPFSGLGSLKSGNSKDSERIYDFDDDELLEEEPKEHVEEVSNSEMDNQIFTCVECSIYFKKQVHLQEHMVEHLQSTSEASQKENSSQFKCMECGWDLPNQNELEGHQRQHQESRDKILKEIEKLNEKDLKKQDALKLDPPISNTNCAIVGLDTRLDRTPVQGRGLGGGYRRRFVCAVCNFSTRTSQALANHVKTHNRKPTSSCLACKYCAFRTTSQNGLREHLKVAHAGPEENGQHSTIVDEADAMSTSQVLTGNRRWNRRGKTWSKVAKYQEVLEFEKLSGSEDEVEEVDLNTGQREVKTTHRTRSLSITDDSLAHRSTARTLPLRRSLRHEDKQDGEREGKVFFLRRSSRVTAVTVDSDDEEGDEERTRRLLSEAVPDEDTEEIDDDMEALKNVERKCPYCPDRFHNGIGLANHVRGHLNRVGVSYNVRHFISPEEVNAIEKRFSYQKKRKKVANFDPGTFSVMHCEFCSAGFDTRAGLSSHARAHLRDLGITNWDVTISPIHLLREVFSSRPDLVIPTAPPRSPYEDEEELDSDEEDDEIIEVKLEGDSGERTEISVLGKSWKCEDFSKECKDEEEEAADEEDADALQLGTLSSVPGKAGLLQDPDRSPREDAPTKANDLKCEVCGAQFETRRGLSSHARSHLRQLGIRGSESSGAPINFLYQIAKERNLDSQIQPRNSTPPAGQKDEVLGVMDVDKKPVPPSILAKVAKAVPHVSSRSSTPSPGASPAPAHSSSPSSVVRKAPISSLLPVSSPLRSLEHKIGGIKTLSSNLNTIPTSKPLWAPQESDAPLNLTLEVDPNKDIVCQLCGAWFETRKGLSSHARAHLRHFGVEYSESKGSPIDLLNQLIQSDDFKHKASTLQLDGPSDTQGLGRALSSPKQPLLNLPSSSSPLLYKVTTSSGAATSKSTSASSLLGPPAKRLKPSSMQVFRLSSGELMALPHSEPLKEIGCEFCGEYFENRKGLSSHARSHLRQMGITQWSVNGSPIDTLREIIARRGLPCALPLKPLKTPPPSSPAPPPRSPLSTSSSPPSALLSRLPFAFARRPSPTQMVVSKLNSSAHSSLTGLILKPKPEPVQLEVTSPGTVVRTGGYSTGGLSPTWTTSESVHPLNLALAHEVEPTRDIRCEFCGEYFENRKGLSSHARSHLRQMGITQWTVNGSPIDTLREVMRKRGMGSASSLEPVVKKEVSSPSWDSPRGATLEGVSTYQSPSLKKSPLSLLQSGLRIHKLGGLSSMATSAVVQSGGRFFRMSPLGKRPLSEEGASLDMAHSPPSHLRTYSPLPHDLSFKTKSPPVKHRPDPSCELCGFYFENRKALASHARAHLRQFGVTEWSVNGSPIETLSAWIRSRPQKVLDMHRSYMQGNRSPLKKKCRSPVSVLADPHHVLPVPSQKASSSSSSSSSHWSSSLAVSLARPVNHEVVPCSSKTSEDESTPSLDTTPTRPSRSSPSPSPSRLSGSLPLQAQVARSELNVRLPRGFERRPLKHPSCPDGAERDRSSPRPLRTGTVPALVPKPPSYPLVKLEGNFYTLKCRFCEVEFHGPLSVQEDWIRHLQQHILKMNYKKPAAPKAAAVAPSDAPTSADTSAPVQTSASTSTSSTCTSTPALTSSPPHPPAPAPPAKCGPTHTATELDSLSKEQSTVTPTPV